MLFTFLVFGIFLSLFDVFIIQHLHDNVKRLIDGLKIYFTRATLRLQKNTRLSAGAFQSRTPTIFARFN